MMDRRIKDVVDRNVDLYALLGLDLTEVANRGGPQAITTDEIRSKYKQMAFVYHPDKNTNDSDNSKFHEISVAIQILTDKSLRDEYDHWYHRKNFLQKKQVSETSIYRNADSIAAVQEYGEMLRKMKHFKVPFGDWSLTETNASTKDTESTEDNNDDIDLGSHFYDSATLRLEFDGDPVALSSILEKSQLQRFLFETTTSKIGIDDIHDIYYSSRNDPKQRIIVSYIECVTPERAVSLLRSWQNDPTVFSTDTRIKLSSMTPRVPTHYYHDVDISPTELDPQIMAAIRRQLDSNVSS